MEKFTPLAKILHCRRQWQHGQISPLLFNCSALKMTESPLRKSQNCSSPKNDYEREKKKDFATKFVITCSDGSDRSEVCYGCHGGWGCGVFIYIFSYLFVFLVFLRGCGGSLSNFAPPIQPTDSEAGETSSDATLHLIGKKIWVFCHSWLLYSTGYFFDVMFA